MSPRKNNKSTTVLPESADHGELTPDFFDRDVHDVARDLLGRELVRVVEGRECRGKIVEVEVYEGTNDLASHARSGEPTERTAPMFAEPGTIYVYTIYGIHHCLNLRSPSSEGPGAILIRACAPVAEGATMAVGRGLVDSLDEYSESLDKKLMSGPAKCCQALQITPQLSGSMIGDGLRIDEGEALWRRDPSCVEKSPRVGLNPKTCGESVDWLWRYYISDCAWTS